MKRWESFLNEAVEDELITPEIRDICVDVVEELQDSASSKATPAIILQDENGVLLFWDYNDIHFDVEVFHDGSLEWFFRNRNTEEIDGSETLISCACTPERGLSTQALDKFKKAVGYRYG